MKYNRITNEEFDNVLAEIVKENASSLMTIPGVYEAVSEHFNNEVLDRVMAEHAEKRKVHLMAVVQNVGKYGFLNRFDTPYI